jgi:hypothetical protein
MAYVDMTFLEFDKNFPLRKLVFKPFSRQDGHADSSVHTAGTMMDIG